MMGDGDTCNREHAIGSSYGCWKILANVGRWWRLEDAAMSNDQLVVWEIDRDLINHKK